MRLTTKGRFAVTAMIDLGLHATTGPVTLASISQRRHISLSYLEQLFSKLRRHGLVDSTRGPGGGYKLARPSADVTIAQIIVAVDEPMDATQCGGLENCDGQNTPCMTHELWTALNRKMFEYLDSVTLQHLLDSQMAHAALTEPKHGILRAISNLPAPAPVLHRLANSVFALGGLQPHGTGKQGQTRTNKDKQDNDHNA